ncbi:alkyl hydroperoxide reductase subunit c, partial [mine drainage metagenome]
GWAQTSPRVQKSTIPMVEDFNKEITKRFGLLNAQSGQARRSVVIIDPDGNIQYMAAFNNNLGKDADHILNAFLGLKYLRDHPAKEGHMCAIPANWKKGNDALDIDVVKDIGKL